MERIKATTQTQKPTTSRLQRKQEEAQSTGVVEITKKKPEDILISFNFDGNLKLDFTKIEFAFVTKKGLDEDIKTAKKLLKSPNISEKELKELSALSNRFKIQSQNIICSPDPELRGYARQDYYVAVTEAAYIIDKKLLSIRGEKNLSTPEGQKAADVAIDTLVKTLNSVEMPDYNKYGNVKKTLDQTVVHWFGTSVEEVWDEYHKSFDQVKTLRRSKTKDPVAFAKTYNSLTGVEFNPEKILAVNELKEKCQQNYSGMVASEQILNKLKAGQETLKKGNSVENLNELKQQTLEICSLLSGQSAEEVEKELAKQFETINNKSFSKASEAEKADAYSKILNFYTADEKINSVKETYENFKKSYKKNNEEYKTLFKEAYGENKLSKAVQDNQEDIETAYTVTKVAVVIGATIATGGVAGAVGAGAMATIAATSGAAALATATVETTEKATDGDGLNWQETKNIGKEALIAGMFAALGGGANALGSVAKGASAKYVASTIAQRAIGETVEFGTDVATSYLATKAIGGETTWGSEAMQSGLPQLGFMVAGGFANRIARGAKGAMNAADSVDASAFKNISNVADGVDIPFKTETPTMKELWAKLEKEVAKENASLKPVQKTLQEATEMPENIGAGRKRLQELMDRDTMQTQIMTSFKDELKTFKLENIKEEKLKTEYIRALNRIKRYKNLLPEDKIREVIENLDSKCKRLNAGGSAVLKTSDLIKAYYTGGSYLGLNDMLRGTKRWSIKKKSIGIQEAHSFEECIQYNLELALKRKREIEIIQLLDNRMVSEASEPMTVYRGENGEWSNSRSLNNNIIEDKGFCSTSLSKETGKQFARFGGKFWTINLPKGTKFCDLRSSAEQEILLPRNSRFKVIDAEKRILELIVEN